MNCGDTRKTNSDFIVVSNKRKGNDGIARRVWLEDMIKTFRNKYNVFDYYLISLLFLSLVFIIGSHWGWHLLIDTSSEKNKVIDWEDREISGSEK